MTFIRLKKILDLFLPVLCFRWIHSTNQRRVRPSTATFLGSMNVLENAFSGRAFL